MKEIKVLIVEDEAIVADDLKGTLQNWGHTVLGIASSGEEAIQMAAEQRPDLVLMDIVLRGDADGIETAAQLRGRFDIPVIFVTAHADDEMLRRARLTEPFGYVLKPFDEQELHVNIQMALYKHEMEKKLRASEARYRAIVEDQTELICRFDLDTTLSFVNDAYCRYFGHERESLIGRSFLTLIPGEEHETVRERLASLASTSRKATFEHRVVAADGSVRWLQWSDRAICDDQGRMVEIQSVGRDTTERVRAEKKARRRTAQLRALREVGLEITAQLDLEVLLISIVSQAVKLLDGATGCFCLHQPERDVLECAVSIGQHAPSIGTVVHRGQDLAGRVWESGAPLIVNDHRNWDGWASIFERCPDAAVVGMPVQWGSEFLGVLSVSAHDHSVRTFSSSDGELLSLFATQAAIAIKNARLYEGAQQDAETKAMLLREIDHRVKNNLTGIIGLLYTARRYAKVKDQATYQSVINDLIGRVRGLAEVHNMLSASKWTPLLLSDLAGGVIRAALHALPPGERHVSLNIRPSPVRVTPDQAHSLALVINELALNTLKHALGERGALHVAFRIALDDGLVRCEFQDDGPGYPEHALQFERHGVGLDLVQNIVRNNLDGDFVLRNDHGAVALVRFRCDLDV